LGTIVGPGDEEVAVRYSSGIPNFGNYAHARVQEELAHEVEEAGWDGVFLWDHILFWTSKRVPMVDPWIALAAMAMSTTGLLGFVRCPVD
jgi:alkanesulfonate monooxygenase SsuD/methylene tetrahydromethanopterin reductase-like flavin-dependent oxidoreductase (luciferase family)